jgi:hypothetical protein
MVLAVAISTLISFALEDQVLPSGGPFYDGYVQAQTDSNATVTTSAYTPRYIGDVLIGTVSNFVYIAENVTTGGWIKVSN